MLLPHTTQVSVAIDLEELVRNERGATKLSSLLTFIAVFGAEHVLVEGRVEVVLSKLLGVVEALALVVLVEIVTIIAGELGAIGLEVGVALKLSEGLIGRSTEVSLAPVVSVVDLIVLVDAVPRLILILDDVLLTNMGADDRLAILVNLDRARLGVPVRLLSKGRMPAILDLATIVNDVVWVFRRISLRRAKSRADDGLTLIISLKDAGLGLSLREGDLVSNRRVILVSIMLGVRMHHCLVVVLIDGCAILSQLVANGGANNAILKMALVLPQLVELLADGEKLRFPCSDYCRQSEILHFH